MAFVIVIFQRNSNGLCHTCQPLIGWFSNFCLFDDGKKSLWFIGIGIVPGTECNLLCHIACIVSVLHLWCQGKFLPFQVAVIRYFKTCIVRINQFGTVGSTTQYIGADKSQRHDEVNKISIQVFCFYFVLHILVIAADNKLVGGYHIRCFYQFFLIEIQQGRSGGYHFHFTEAEIHKLTIAIPIVIIFYGFSNHYYHPLKISCCTSSGMRFSLRDFYQHRFMSEGHNVSGFYNFYIMLPAKRFNMAPLKQVQCIVIIAKQNIGRF